MHGIKKLLAYSLIITSVFSIIFNVNSKKTYAASNLINDSNTSFTSGLGNWSNFYYSGTGTNLSIGYNGWNGLNYIKLTGSSFGDSGAELHAIPVKPNTDYVISAKMKIPNGATRLGNGAILVTNLNDSVGLWSVYNPSNIGSTDWMTISDKFNTYNNSSINIRLDRGDASEMDFTDIKLVEYVEPTITATTSGANNLNLQWSSNDTNQQYSYMVYKKDVNDGTFQTIPVKSRINVLNIYPSVGNNLKTWMETHGYGKGLISVDEVTMDGFNANPTGWLKDAYGNWKYDVIYIGAWDCNNNKDLTPQSLDVVKQFIEAGRGYLGGHDTEISWNSYSRINLDKLRTYMKVKIAMWGTPVNDNFSSEYADFPVLTGGTWDNKITIKKKGLLTTYPWNIGSVGTSLIVPGSHSTANFAYGDVWMNYTGHDAQLAPDNVGVGNFYLTTWNNTAMIQTGHSNGAATDDEQKLVANTLFYLSQVTNGTYWIDNSAQDLTGPNKVSSYGFYIGSDNKSHISIVRPQDLGNTYEYYVEATGSTDLLKRKSKTVSNSCTTGVRGYYYILDNSPSTIVDSSNGNLSTSDDITIGNTTATYLHISAIDGATPVSNVGQTTHILLDKIAPSNPTITTNPIINTAPLNWTNSNVLVTLQGGADYQSGMSRREYSINGGLTWNTYTTPFTLSIENKYSIMARTLDNAGNYSSAPRVDLGIDRTPPIATATISQDTTTLSSAIVTKRNVVVNLSYMSDNVSGQYTARIANKADFSDATGYINVQSLASKQINFTLDQRTPYTANYTDRTVYIELKDIAGNAQILQATTKLEPFAPSVPIITNPLNNTVRLIKEGTMIEWKYSDPNNDPNPLAQAKSELFIYKGTDLIKDFVLNGTASSVYVNDLPYGEYTVKVTVWNSLGKSATSNPSTLRINKFLNEGSLITKAFETSSPIKYVEVLTTSEIPFGTELYANIYIADKDGNYDSSKPIETEIHNVRDNKNLKKLPYPTSNLRIQYKLYNKTSPVNDTLTPIIDNVTILAK